MVVCCLLVTFLMTVNHSDQVSVQAENVTDILDKLNESVMQTLTSDSENINGLKNESEQECDCGFGSKGCHYNVYGEKICDCMGDYAQNNDQCERCYCGLNVRSCTLKNDKKVCTCLENDSRNDYYEKCADNAIIVKLTTEQPNMVHGDNNGYNNPKDDFSVFISPTLKNTINDF
ncbi:uncharacterized protein [Parasteatoda tepidariorum]|uniref:uncharacterized protein n=1 Tax=Parasteatoda tepidariorum TaxID=114398 RepID=UPI0039BD349C